MPALDAAVFETLADAGTWEGAPVRLILREPDEVETYAGGEQVVVGARFLEVQRSEVARPRKGHIARLGDGVVKALRAFQVIGTPTLDEFGRVWTCEAQEL